MINSIYCDNAATTPLCESVKKSIVDNLDKFYNPSSLYQPSHDLTKEINEVRKIIGKTLGAVWRAIYFTSGATEGNNTVLRSFAKIGKEQGKMHIVSTEIEHPSVLTVLEELKNEGYEVTLVKPMKNGVIDIVDVEEAIREDTAFVSCMAVNNEVGTIQPILDIGKLCYERGILFHVDATAAFGNIPIDVDLEHINALTISGHKIGAPKGIGCVYYDLDYPMYPLIYGGGQEFGNRSGTENTLAILALGEAVKEKFENSLEKNTSLYIAREKLLDKLLKIPDSMLNGDREHRLPNNINISFKGMTGWSLALMLASDDICVSTASACSSERSKQSHVLKAMDTDADYINGTVRFTLPLGLTDEDINFIAEATAKYVRKLRDLGI